ncbi:hypothetical protein SGLAM104S_02952 [Streptomyces glaucescens]
MPSSRKYSVRSSAIFLVRQRKASGPTSMGEQGRGRVARAGGGGAVQVDAQGGHPGVVHATDREAHDEARADAPQEPSDLAGRREGGGGGGHRYDDRGGDGEGVVLQLSVQAHSGHAQVVHRRDAQTGDGAAGEQGGPGGAPVADDEDPDAHHDDGDGQAGEGRRSVVVDRRLLDSEPHHRDEVHGPDAGADGRRAEREPAGAPGSGHEHGSGGAAQAECAAEAGHEIGHQRRDEAVAESVDRALHARLPFRPLPSWNSLKRTPSHNRPSGQG